MRISERIVTAGVLIAGLAGPALAFDGKTDEVAPAVSVDVVPRRAVTGSALGVMSVAPVGLPPAGAPLPSVPALPIEPMTAPQLRAFDISRHPSPGEAFRSGTQLLREGVVNFGVQALQYAASRGHPVAQWKLGRMYAEGEGVKQDDLRAFEYFREIVETHGTDSPGTLQSRFVANAFVALASYYLEGIPNTDVKADPDRARELFAYAASYYGDADAQYNLGRLYLEGTGAPKEPKLGARWLGLAANKGQPYAQAILGAILFKGEIVPRQAPLGLMWLTLASDGAPTEKWIKELHDSAFAQATDDERSLALMYIERRVAGSARLPR